MATSALLSDWLRRRRHAPTTELVVRALLCAAAVVVCYQFPWEFLRLATSELVMRTCALAGLSMHRVAFDTIVWNGSAYQFVIACCFVDVWCGAVPLLWDLRRTVAFNVAKLAMLFVALMALNIFRLSLSYVFCAYLGGSWDLVHGLIGGFAYFAVWVWLWNHRPWRAFTDEPVLTAS